ncbi:MAG: hypothetical protein ACI841_000093 [Planctomycetota bacterium]|jgi:hypothetical protein
MIALGGPLIGFELLDQGGVWQRANGRVEQNKVLLDAGSINGVVAVRYGWAPLPDCNLFNAAGFPVSPFTTAEFPLFHSGRQAFRRPVGMSRWIKRSGVSSKRYLLAH